MNRRSLIASGLSLPFMSAIAAKQDFRNTVKPKVKKNVVFFCMDFGFLRQDLFYGKNGDCDSEYFDMLKDIKGKYTFFHSIHQPNLLNSSHSAHPAALSCVKGSQKSIYALESVDQYIGRQSLRENRHKSIIFATSRSGRVSWNSSAQRVPGVSNINDFHTKLFGEVDASQELRATSNQLKLLSRAHNEIVKKSSTEADKLLAHSFKLKVDELKEDILWIKKGQSKVDIETDSSLGKGDQHIRMGEALSLCAEAFTHKRTKVATVYFDGSGHVDLKGVKSGFHGLSHKPKNPEALVQKRIVDEYVLKSVVEHVQDLEKRQMLNDTIVVVTGAMGNSASHSNYKLPVFLMGGGLKHQGVVNCIKEKKLQVSLADVYQTIVAELGLPTMELPYCNGSVKELLS